MKNENSQNKTLFNSQGVSTERNLVQFVELKKYQNEGELTDIIAEKVLKEIPKQIEEYYRLHGI